MTDRYYVSYPISNPLATIKALRCCRTSFARFATELHRLLEACASCTEASHAEISLKSKLLQYSNRSFLVISTYCHDLDHACRCPFIFRCFAHTRVVILRPSFQSSMSFRPVFNAVLCTVLQHVSMNSWNLVSYCVLQLFCRIQRLLSAPISEIAAYHDAAAQGARRNTRNLRFHPCTSCFWLLYTM